MTMTMTKPQDQITNCDRPRDDHYNNGNITLCDSVVDVLSKEDDVIFIGYL
jgi:hypothetical protein